MNVLALPLAHSKIARRQKALWFAVLPLTAFAVLLSAISPAAPHTGGSEDLAFTAKIIAIFTGIAYAAAFSDFFTASARLGMHELEASTPVHATILRAARVAGAFTVIFAPSFVVLLAMGIRQAVAGHALSPIIAIAVSLTIVAPASLIAMTISGLAGAVLPRAIGRIAAVMIWFWLVFSSPMLPVPTLNGSFLGVIGDTVGAGYFGSDPIYAPSGALGLAATPLTATVSLLWQVALIVILLAVGSWITDRSRRH
ncbi:hypothetical protein [Brevibacterium luteolum]|uniref:hypothetical protein n=1 Tax=Brevibacterium luteolum TaxID=199591 RepID=UPI00223A8F01|nr:hypothetical protein [Brevibacterium luteolum]MCT1658299.1 hypothetical protein [Brevibacterium luteolum]MCT1830684.1 hypothetical protein [Brevibacterium luteolum]MCT1922780.1 hypothetical protein [Brevibacterium luteolum]